jgi:hypothetical protein
MVKAPDPLWGKATPNASPPANGEKWTCNFCGDPFSGGVNGLAAHLRGASGENIVACGGEVPADVLQLAEQYAAAAGKRKAAKEQQEARKKLREARHQQQLMTSHFTIKKGTPSEEADMAAVELVAACGTSFSLLENEAFRSFVSKAAQAGPDYKPPTRKVRKHCCLLTRILLVAASSN